jgi:Asp-tRNA(Asn)/Glu-tRNA(Gln) amidotransferase A subunit family amidase
MGGSVLFETVTSTESSPMVRILESNGGIPVAKSNSPEFGFNASTINALHGPTRNPYDTRLTVGGSSGGAAASVATGEVWLATGSDLGSSIRLPAAFCGVAGLRPSPGRIPRARRGMPFSTLPVLGPIARTVADVALGMEAMVGESWSDPLSLPSRPGMFTEAVVAPAAPRRVAWSPDLGVTPVDHEVAARCAAAVARFAEAGGVACDEDARVVLVFRDDEVGEGFVVDEADIEAGADVLDEAVLGEERFPLALAEQDLEVVDEVAHRLLLGAEVGGGDEVAGGAVGQVRGLADIEHDALVVFHEVDAGRFGQVAGFAQQATEALLVRLGAPGRGRVGGEEAVFVFDEVIGVVGHRTESVGRVCGAQNKPASAGEAG